MAYIVPREIPKSCKDCQFHYCSEYHPFWVKNEEKRNTKTYRCQAALPFRSTVLDIDDETFKPDWCPLVDATDTNVGHKSEWISVEERLPEKEGKYLICTDRGYVTFGFFGNYDGNGNLTILRNNPRFDYRNVIYWMPLPEPPKL